MGLLSHRVESSDIRAGDHIYSWRTAFAYSHHGIYVGGNKVVHYTHNGDLSLSDLSSSTHFSSSISNSPLACVDNPDCGFRKSKSGVIISCLNHFLGNGLLYRFEYGVNRLTFISRLRGGTCTIAKSDPPEEVVYRAMHLLQNGFGNYNVLCNNCEDFALYCKTGRLVFSEKDLLGSSGQASSVVGAPLAAILSWPLRLVVPSPVSVITAAAVVYSFNRYATDIGVRDDVTEVKVEDMALFNGERESVRSIIVDKCI